MFRMINAPCECWVIGWWWLNFGLGMQMFGLCLIFPRVCKTQIIRKRSGLFGLNSYSQHTIAMSVKGWERTLATGSCALESRIRPEKYVWNLLSYALELLTFFNFLWQHSVWHRRGGKPNKLQVTPSDNTCICNERSCLIDVLGQRVTKCQIPSLRNVY